MHYALTDKVGFSIWRILSKWQHWRYFTHQSATTWCMDTQRLPSAYAVSTISSWSKVHSFLLDQEKISYRSSCSSCWGDALQKRLSPSFQIGSGWSMPAARCCPLAHRVHVTPSCVLIHITFVLCLRLFNGCSVIPGIHVTAVKHWALGLHLSLMCGAWPAWVRVNLNVLDLLLLLS